MKRERFKWTIEIEVDETWVADGFDLATDEHVRDLIQNRLPYALGHEVGGRIVKRPTDRAIATAQGYRTVEAYRKARK